MQNTTEFPAAAGTGTNLSPLDSLIGMGSDQLEQLYRKAQTGAIPDGISRGAAMFFPGSRFNRFIARIATFFWQGKVFNKGQGSLINRVMGFRAVKAKVYQAESLFDGKPATIIDYQGTSMLFGRIRDEIRQIGPGLYLGRAYVRTANPFVAVHFALDFNR